MKNSLNEFIIRRKKHYSFQTNIILTKTLAFKNQEKNHILSISKKKENQPNQFGKKKVQMFIIS